MQVLEHSDITHATRLYFVGFVRLFSRESWGSSIIGTRSVFFVLSACLCIHILSSLTRSLNKRAPAPSDLIFALPPPLQPQHPSTHPIHQSVNKLPNAEHGIAKGEGEPKEKEGERALLSGPTKYIVTVRESVLLCTRKGMSHNTPCTLV